jgi:hypothetical protein
LATRDWSCAPARRRLIAGERLHSGEQATFSRFVTFLRGELERLHAELIDRLQKEQGSWRSWTIRETGWATRIAIGAIIGALALGAVAYGENWVWHHDPRGHDAPSKSTPAPASGL